MKQNAIVSRIERLSDQWYAFAEARDARLLCWGLAHDEPSMVDAFLESESHEQLAEHPDLFAPMALRFQNRMQHGFELATSLVAEAFADWEPLPPRREERDIAYLIRTCEALRVHYEMPGKLVLVLRPERVEDATAYLSWLHELAHEAPPLLRVIVLEELDQPAYGKLTEAQSPAVVAVRAELDMAGALQQLSKEAGDLDTPGGRFRGLFLRLTNLVAEGDLEGAARIGEVALALVTELGEWHLAVPVHFALAGGLLTASRPQEAALQFAAAEAAATRGEREGGADMEATYKTLRQQSRVGYASALLADKDCERAARAFEAAAALALELGDLRGALDCHRLACFGWERAGRLDEALREGRAGLDVARAMDSATLETSTFQHLREGLLRITCGLQRRGLRRAIEHELADLAAPSA